MTRRARIVRKLAAKGKRRRRITHRSYLGMAARSVPAAGGFTPPGMGPAAGGYSMADAIVGVQQLGSYMRDAAPLRIGR